MGWKKIFYIFQYQNNSLVQKMLNTSVTKIGNKKYRIIDYKNSQSPSFRSLEVKIASQGREEEDEYLSLTSKK